MGVDVHLHVAMPCTYNEPLAKIAGEYLVTIEDVNDGARAARWYLEDLSKRTGNNPGPKGGLSLWGIIGNYTIGEDFIDALKPFFKEVFSRRPVDGADIMCTHERVVVFVEREQTEAAEAWQIGFDEDARDLQIKHCPQLPFSWGQY